MAHTRGRRLVQTVHTDGRRSARPVHVGYARCPIPLARLSRDVVYFRRAQPPVFLWVPDPGARPRLSHTYRRRPEILRIRGVSAAGGGRSGQNEDIMTRSTAPLPADEPAA